MTKHDPTIDELRDAIGNLRDARAFLTQCTAWDSPWWSAPRAKGEAQLIARKLDTALALMGDAWSRFVIENDNRPNTARDLAEQRIRELGR